jgi:predicted RecA/RadA family phage recombinase
MATATFVHDGDSILHTPSSDVSAGDVVVQGDLVGIAKVDIDADDVGALAVVGVFDVPKATGGGEAIDAGAVVYWDEGDSVAKEDDEAGANTLLGKCIADAGDDDATVRVRLSQ